MPIDEHKRLALELANQHGAQDGKLLPVTEIVARATAYHSFLTGGPQVVAGTATQTGGKAATTGGKAAATGGKAAATGDKPAQPKQPAAPEPTQDDVNKALHAVLNADPKGKKVGLTTAISLMTSAGGGATKLENLKPALFGAVIQAATKQLAFWKAQAGSTAQATVDADAGALGAAPAGDDDNDLPEQGSGDDM